MTAQDREVHQLLREFTGRSPRPWAGAIVAMANVVGLALVVGLMFWLATR